MRQTYADIENNAYNEQRRADLRALQALPLKDKIKMTQELINEAIAVYGEKHVYLSFSGGKDSTVLSHIARIQHPNLLHVFSDTSCEYPETIAFVEGLKETGINITIKDLWKSSNINGLQAASKAFIKRETKTRKGAAQSSFEVAPFLCKF